MNKLIVLLLLIGVNICCYAQDSAEDRQDKLITQLLSQQVNQQISLVNSVSAILARYPEKVDAVIHASLDLYPTRYKEILVGAMRAEPVLACEVLAIFLNENIADPLELVALAVEAEPAYAQEIVNIAMLHNPEITKEIVNTAINTEPVLSDSVVQNSLTSFPDKVLEILSGAIKALPQQVASYVKDAIALFPDMGEEVVEMAVHNSADIEARKIVASAIEAGLNEGPAIEAAIAGGTSKELLARGN